MRPDHDSNELAPESSKREYQGLEIIKAVASFTGTCRFMTVRDSQSRGGTPLSPPKNVSYGRNLRYVLPPRSGDAFGFLQDSATIATKTGSMRSRTPEARLSPPRQS